MIKEHHLVSDNTRRLEEKSELVSGVTLYMGEELLCPRCKHRVALLLPCSGGLKPTKCDGCGLWMESHGNGLDIWEEK